MFHSLSLITKKESELHCTSLSVKEWCNLGETRSAVKNESFVPILASEVVILLCIFLPQSLNFDSSFVPKSPESSIHCMKKSIKMHD